MFRWTLFKLDKKVIFYDTAVNDVENNYFLQLTYLVLGTLPIEHTSGCDSFDVEYMEIQQEIAKK
jgi:hypothetical protein